MALDYECPVWADVDFGHGPVEIRCTKRGAHTSHACSVYIPTRLEAPRVQQRDAKHSNVFNHPASWQPPEG